MILIGHLRSKLVTILAEHVDTRNLDVLLAWTRCKLALDRGAYLSILKLGQQQLRIQPVLLNLCRSLACFCKLHLFLHSQPLF
jgi:hypothetical protein